MLRQLLLCARGSRVARSLWPQHKEAIGAFCVEVEPHLPDDQAADAACLAVAEFVGVPSLAGLYVEVCDPVTGELFVYGPEAVPDATRDGRARARRIGPVMDFCRAREMMPMPTGADDCYWDAPDCLVDLDF